MSNLEIQQEEREAVGGIKSSARLRYLHPCFLLRQLIEEHRFTSASPEMLNLDMRKTNSICLLPLKKGKKKKKVDRIGAMANHIHT